MTEFIASRRNPLMVHLSRLSKDAAARRETGEILCEGLKLLTDALASGLEPLMVAHTPGLELPPLPNGVRIVCVPAGLIESVSAQKTPQGLLFTLKRPSAPETPDARGKHILLDRVQDPGNVGAVIRTAEAFSLASVMLTPGCADPFSPKALRGAMGAALRLPVYHTTPEDLPPLPLVALDLEGDDIREWTPGPCIAVIGSEGGGIAPELLSRCERKLKIPMTGQAESLNAAAAAAILMWEMNR